MVTRVRSLDRLFWSGPVKRNHSTCARSVRDCQRKGQRTFKPGCGYVPPRYTTDLNSAVPKYFIRNPVRFQIPAASPAVEWGVPRRRAESGNAPRRPSPALIAPRPPSHRRPWPARVRARRGTGELIRARRARRSRGGALSFCHLSLFRLQQTGDPWTATPHKFRLCRFHSSTA